MNRFVRKLLVAIMTLMLLTSIGTPVFAADDCGCSQVVHVTGLEKYKILADLMKTDAFKAESIELLKAGYRLDGLNSLQSIDVEKNANGEILVAIPLLDPQGKQVFLLCFRGMFIVTPPMN